MARAVINHKCADVLSASGDGRIVHLAGPVPYKMAKPNFEDLQFEASKWTFFEAILTTHILGFMFLDEASRRWTEKPITLHASGIGTTKTNVMTNPEMHWIMRAMAVFGTTPEKSAQNAIRLLLSSERPEPSTGVLKSSSKFKISPFDHPREEAENLWNITTKLAEGQGIALP